MNPPTKFVIDPTYLNVEVTIARQGEAAPPTILFNFPFEVDEYNAGDLIRRIAADSGFDCEYARAKPQGQGSTHGIRFRVLAPCVITDADAESLARRVFFGLRVFNWSHGASVEEAYCLCSILDLAHRAGDATVERLARDAIVNPGTTLEAQLAAVAEYAETKRTQIEPNTQSAEKSLPRRAVEAAVIGAASQVGKTAVDYAKDVHTWIAMGNLVVAAQQFMHSR